MTPKQTRTRTITTAILTLLLLFITGSCFYYVAVVGTSMTTPLINIDSANNPGLMQFLALPFVVLFCGISLFMLLRGNQLTRTAIAVIVSLSLFIASCLIYHATQTTAPCYYDPNVNLNEDFVSHMVCPSDNATEDLYIFIFNPLVSTVADLVLVAGIGTLGFRLAKNRTKQRAN